MRPIYETSEDRQKEQDVFAMVADTFGCVCITTPKLSVADRLLCSAEGVLLGIVELKIRTNPYAKYPTYMLSATKHTQLMNTARALRVPAFLVVKFSDSVKVTRLQEDYPTSVGGRRDRGDNKDIEKCIFIPIEEFTDAGVKHD
jgi:hypothetical protein